MAKLPSGRFPFINLAKAIARAKSIFENDRGGKGLRMPVAFSAWGYSDKSSGGFQTVAALKQYSLLVDEGANDDRSVRLTEGARRYFQTEIEADKQKLERDFALRPPLMNHLFKQWEEGVVDDPVARTYLKTEIGLNEQSARSALGIYKENLSRIQGTGAAKPTVPYGEISDSNRDGEGVTYGGARVGDWIDYESGGVLANTSPLRVRALSPDQSWVFVDGSETGLKMEQVIVRERPESDVAPKLPLDATKEETAAKLRVNDLRPLFDFDSVTIKTKITSQWHLSELINRLQKLMPMLPEGAKEADDES